jgi:hypothetical protein
MERDDNFPPLKWLCNLCVRRKATCRNAGKRTISKHPLDGVRGGSSAKAEKANRGDFIGAKARMLRFEVNNELAHVWWESPRFLFRMIWWSLRKQACHAMFLQRRGSATY